MKKLLSVCVFLGMLVTCQITYAGLVTYTTLSGDSGVSYEHLNTSFANIYDEFDGSIDSDNIQNDSLTEADFADAINPRVRDYELMGDFTYSGMLPAAPASGLVAQTSAGVSFVMGYRIVTDTTDHTYTASKDTYVYIDQNGGFVYAEVANGGTQPTTPSNSLLLAKVISDGTDVTSVTDLRRTTPPNLRIYQDYKQGLVVSRDTATATTVTIGRGTIDFGSGVSSGLRRNITDTSINFLANGRGGLDTGALAEGFYYIHSVADDDNATGYEGIASISSTDATGVTGERLVGWCYAPNASAISPDSVGSYRGVGGDSPNTASNEATVIASTASTSLVDLMTLKFYSSGRPVLMTYNLAANNGNTGNKVYAAISVDNAGYANTFRGVATPAQSATDPGMMLSSSSILHLTAGEHTIKLRWKVDSNTGYAFGRSLTACEL